MPDEPVRRRTHRRVPTAFILARAARGPHPQGVKDLGCAAGLDEGLGVRESGDQPFQAGCRGSSARTRTSAVEAGSVSSS